MNTTTLHSVRDIPLALLPRVFSPRPRLSHIRGPSTFNIRYYAKKRVLDMGCGSGIQSILAEKSGASVILAVDCCPYAVTNTLLNAQKNKCTRIFARQSNLFSNVYEQFDTIIAYLPSIATEYGNHTTHDYAFRLHARFLRDAVHYLSHDGVIILSCIDDTHFGLLKKLIKKYKFTPLEIIQKPSGWRIVVVGRKY